jgi:hypothetical protein
MSNKEQIVYKIRELDPDIIAPSTKNMNTPEKGGSKIVVIGKPGCHAPGTKILMFDGNLKNVEDVKVGDQIMGDDSTPRNVLGLCQGIDEMYRMTPIKGESYVLNEQHILTLKQVNAPDIIDISIEYFLTMSKEFQRSFKWFRRLPSGVLETEDFKLESIGTGEYYGFELNGNHRYLLGDFSVTHNSGKSFLIKSLLYEKNHIFPVGIVMNGTEDSNHFYAGTTENPGMFPPAFVYNHLDKEKLQDVTKRQVLAKNHLPNPWAAVVLDDLMDDPKLFNDPILAGWFKNGRHWKGLFILGLQYCLDIRPAIRVNIDGTFIFREANIKFRKLLWENFSSIVPDFTVFCTLMDELTDDNTALFIHNATTSNKIEDCVFWYKAKPVPKDFRFGCQDYWDYNNERYNPLSNDK